MRIHAKSMSVERDIRWELIARLTPNATGADLRSIATEAGVSEKSKSNGETGMLTKVDVQYTKQTKDRYREGLPGGG